MVKLGQLVIFVRISSFARDLRGTCRAMVDGGWWLFDNQTTIATINGLVAIIVIVVIAIAIIFIDIVPTLNVCPPSLAPCFGVAQSPQYASIVNDKRNIAFPWVRIVKVNVR
jgi:hypothetical protein